VALLYGKDRRASTRVKSVSHSGTADFWLLVQRIRCGLSVCSLGTCLVAGNPWSPGITAVISGVIIAFSALLFGYVFSLLTELHTESVRVWLEERLFSDLRALSTRVYGPARKLSAG